MSSFLLNSLIASAVLTLLLNVVPRFFPGATRRAEQKLHDYLLEAEEVKDPSKPRTSVQVHFPWKAMLIASIVLTVLVNVIGLAF